jgi:4,5-dihydroxyphthalate decarboxylase
MILQMLLDGELDAVFGERSDDPRLKTLFPDPALAAQAWHKKHGLVPLNHMVVVSEDLARSRPEIVGEVYTLLKESKRRGATPAADGIDYVPFGVEACRPALERIIDYAAQQRLIPRRFTMDELFDDTTRALG